MAPCLFPFAVAAFSLAADVARRGRCLLACKEAEREGARLLIERFGENVTPHSLSRAQHVDLQVQGNTSDVRDREKGFGGQGKELSEGVKVVVGPVRGK